MFEITKRELNRRRAETIGVAIGFAGLVLALLAVVSEIGAFGDGTGMHTIGTTIGEIVGTGTPTPETLDLFFASGVYQFGWVLGLGSYFAYSAGSLLTDDRDRMDVLLSAPISRSTIVRERYLALFVGMILVNVVVCGTVYVGSIAIGSPIDPMKLLVVHALSIPYLLVCASIGLLFSVGFSSGTRASVASVAVVIGLFVLERRAPNEMIRQITPTQYYDPTAILLSNPYTATDGLYLLGAALVIGGVSRLWFSAKDL